jgi:hypothetical protein
MVTRAQGLALVVVIVGALATGCFVVLGEPLIAAGTGAIVAVFAVSTWLE